MRKRQRTSSIGLLSIGVSRSTTSAGPERFRFDEAVATVLGHDQDPRQVIADPAAPYYGVALGDTTLVPGPAARLGSTTLDWWLAHVPAPVKVQQKVAVPQPAH